MIFSFKKKKVLGYCWSTLIWHRCYYPHRSRDTLSPVCGIFLKCHPNLPKYYKFNCRNNANFKIRHCLISGCLISGGCLINQVHARSNQAAAWSIRLLPDQNQAAAWSIRHMPDQNQAAAWSIQPKLSSSAQSWEKNLEHLKKSLFFKKSENLKKNIFYCRKKAIFLVFQY